jgi:secretion/DNA translocation related TadE-like protein
VSPHKSGREPSRPAIGDLGSATILGCALMCVCLVVGLAALALGELSAARAKLSSAADLAALAGADHLTSGDPCSAAERVAVLGGGRLAQCEVEGGDVMVTISGDPPGLVAKIVTMAGAEPPTIQVRARAGPPP